MTLFYCRKLGDAVLGCYWLVCASAAVSMAHKRRINFKLFIEFIIIQILSTCPIAQQILAAPDLIPRSCEPATHLAFSTMLLFEQIAPTY